MSQLAWATDVHFNALENPRLFEHFVESVRVAGVQCLLLGGDIAEAEDVRAWLDRLRKRLDLPIYYVLGNHDFYGGWIDEIRGACGRSSTDRLAWLPAAGIVELSERCALVGHDGWGDGRAGKLDGEVILTDYLAIQDLVREVDLDDLVSGFQRRERLLAKVQELGNEAASALAPQLEAALNRYEHVIVLTHVPPFREVCCFQGKPSPETWLAGFVCGALGDLLRACAGDFPDRRISVLSGHTHCGARSTLGPNLQAEVGSAQYGELHLHLVEADRSGLHLEQSLKLG